MRKWTNQHKRTRNNYPRAGTLLDNTQKARICILAREAFEKMESFLPFADWRQMEQQNAVGKDSLRDCTQADYLSLVAHFEKLKGEDGRAVQAHLRSQVKDQALALFKLKEACRERALDLAYPAAICRRQFKCTLEEASPNQLWNLLFTIKNRRNAVAADA